jgi:soluble lytic murein transglycosylase-like protein
MPVSALVGTLVGILAACHAAQAGAQGTNPPRVVLPAHLPAACFVQAARDYVVPELVLAAMVKVESGGRSVVANNRDGSQDIGVAQHNTRSWVPYFERRYGIKRDDLLSNPCQSIRAQAYTLRTEWNHRRCAQLPAQEGVWCAVGRYHAPSNQTHARNYVQKVQKAYVDLIASGRF